MGMSEYKNDSKVFIATAECETKSGLPSTGASLCKALNTSYFPHLSYGYPGHMKDSLLPKLPHDITYKDLKDFVESHKPGAAANSDAPPMEPASQDFICPATSSVVV